MEIIKSEKKQRTKKKVADDSASVRPAFDVGAVPEPFSLEGLTIGNEEAVEDNVGKTEKEGKNESQEVIVAKEMDTEEERPVSFDRTLSIASTAAEKDMEDRRSSSFVRELPLEALLPRSNSRDDSATTEHRQSENSPHELLKEAHTSSSFLAENASAVQPTAAIVYPQINAITVSSQDDDQSKAPEPATVQVAGGRQKMIIPTISIESAPSTSRQTEALDRSMYPKLNAQRSGVSAPDRSTFTGEAELLSEGQLLEFYRNDQLDFVDDFVDVFVHAEIEPRNCLFNLLEKYKKVCDELEDVSTVKANSIKALATLNNEIWDVDPQKIVHQGKCQCGRSATGEATYNIATFKPEKLTALSDEMSRCNRSDLDVGFCLEIRSRTLALQIQWIIVDVINQFFGEHQLNISSFPLLVSTTHSLPSRILLKKALSDLFYFIRFPALSACFRNSVTGWISELGGALLKACTPDDQLFIMSHLLRCPTPLGSWAVGLVQTFISVSSLDLSVPIDNFVAMMSLLLRSIKNREQFMFRIMKYYEGENSWNFVSDDGGSMELNNMSELAESDFIALLSQFSIKSLFSAALKNFTFMHKGNQLQVILSLISFVLVFLKICDEGLETYVSMRGMSKNICDNMRNLVQCFCTYWDLVRAELNEADRVLIQNEVNRILLQAAYYIVSKNSVDLWQFLVDFPYGSVTEYCRLRFQLLFRHSSTMTVQNLYEIPDDELITKIKSSRNLWEQLCDFNRGKEDATYKVLALASVISFCSLEQNFLVFQVIHLCFLDEATRDDYYKVGSEAVALFLERNSTLLPLLLKYIDRHVDHLDGYAVDILTNASKALRECQITVDDVSNVLGKWLINRTIDHPASQIARRVLCSMNWGGSDGTLWLAQEVHDACADTIVKAHIVHCKVQNGMIAKSVTKATKMALKCSDLEQQFSKFCWDVLIKLKITEKPMSSPPTTNDLAAFYLFIQQKCLQSRTGFIDHGLPLFVDIVNASSFKASIMILSQVVSRFVFALDVFTSNPIFRKCVEQIIHADESAYAIQLIVGADDFPGPILSLLASSIEFQIYTESSVAKKKKLAHAWLQILTCKKSIEWNADKFVIYLMGFIAKIAFYFDPDALFDIDKLLENLYKAQYLTWKESSKGIMSWFSTQIHPPIIASNLLTISPWTSFVLLRVEPRLFGAFYDFLDSSLCKHPNRLLDEALKKACSKSHTNFTVDRLHFARWLEFISLDDVIDHEVFPLALQQLCYILLARKMYDRKNHCIGQRLLNSPTVQPMVKQLKCTTLPKLEKATNALKLKSFYHAVLEWLFSDEVYDPHFSKFSNYNLDYLLHMAINGDEHLWMELVDTHQLNQSIESNIKVLMNCYHLHGSAGVPNSPVAAGNCLTKFFEMLDHSPLKITSIPPMPQHKGLPVSEKAEASWYGISPLPLAFSRYLDELSKAAKTFVSGKEDIESLDKTYTQLFKKLYVHVEETRRLSLRCGNFVSSRCPRPTNLDFQVTVSNYDKNVASHMEENRSKREEEISRLMLILDSVAITCAQLEHISRILENYSKMSIYGANGDMDFVKTTGTNLFYKICNFVDGVQFLFPAAVQCYEACLDTLGKAFIAENPTEQIKLMRIVKEGNPLNHFLVVHFTPHSIPAALLFQLYTELSHSVRDPNTSEASLALLSRLDIEHSGNRMPANQFLALMPMIFENIVYVASASPLRQLCMDHFVHAVFHHFPFNFPTGLKLMLGGLDSQAMPVELFTRIISRFDDFAAITNEPYSPKMVQKKMTMTSEQALDCLRLFAEQLTSSRCLLNNRLFATWSQYLESVGRLATYFFRLIVYQAFNSESPTMIIEKELRDLFFLLVSVWGPLLEPLDTGIAPWGISENALAATLLENFITQLNWLPHNIYLPPGSETAESLFWQYFTSKLVNLQRTGTVHVFSVYEAKVVRLNWARFWPTLLDLDAMEKTLAKGISEICPLVVEIIVRIPWFQLLQQQQAGTQPMEASRAFVSLILSILTFCVQRSANYTKSRASMESLVKFFLDNIKWAHAKMQIIEKVGEYIANEFPADLLNSSSSNNDILKTFLCIWREACYFSSILIAHQQHSSPTNTDEESVEDVDLNRKRAVYIRTHLAVMLRSPMERNERRKFYKEMLNKTNHLITTNDKDLYTEIARELTAFWAKIPKEKDMEAMMLTLTEWLREHCESFLLLLVVNTAADKLSVPVGLHLLDECIAIYFTRRLSCDWNELGWWLNIPKRGREWLYTTPRSDSDVQPRFFVLNASLMMEMSQSRSINEEYKIIRCLADYLSSIKPKYVTNDAIFLLCVEKWQRMVIRLFSNSVPVNIANEELEGYTKWLRRIYTDERGGSIFSVVAKLAARKPTTFPSRLQAFANIMELYITQQQRSINQAPRLTPGEPVLNSRIQVFNELKQQKQYQELLSSGIFVNALPYFTQSDAHHLGHAMDLFALIARSLYPNEKYLQFIT